MTSASKDRRPGSITSAVNVPDTMFAIFDYVPAYFLPQLTYRPVKTAPKETPSFLLDQAAPKKSAAVAAFPWEQPAKTRTSAPVVPPINTAIGINSNASRSELISAAAPPSKVAAAFPWETKVDLVKAKPAPRPRVEDEDDGLESIAV